MNHVDDRAECKPCVFFRNPAKGCKNGVRCLFCHFTHPLKKRMRWSKKKRSEAKALACLQSSSTPHSPRGGDDDRPSRFLHANFLTASTTTTARCLPSMVCINPPSPLQAPAMILVRPPSPSLSASTGYPSYLSSVPTTTTSSTMYNNNNLDRTTTTAAVPPPPPYCKSDDMSSSESMYPTYESLTTAYLRPSPLIPHSYNSPTRYASPQMQPPASSAVAAPTVYVSPNFESCCRPPPPPPPQTDDNDHRSG
eukprot:GHVS01033969.1.p1 GENE.GHVS01033969.1~~GHVS01033969.1.p1  ORF type:complete len:252 (+),score=55.14 GHVS01033969.1:251-1006(+)